MIEGLCAFQDRFTNKDGFIWGEPFKGGLVAKGNRILAPATGYFARSTFDFMQGAIQKRFAAC